jgi:mono/diheme cytochrome c family protein
MFSELGVLRGRDGIKSDSDAAPTGAELFQGNCTSCHSAQGQGSRDGYYPSLFHNSATGAKNAINLIAAILYGVDRTVSGRQPTDANQLSDRDIAVLGTYVLTHYGAENTTITEQQVGELRRGGPSSPLLALARGPCGRDSRCNSGHCLSHLQKTQGLTRSFTKSPRLTAKQTRRSVLHRRMSAFGGKADMTRTCALLTQSGHERQRFGVAHTNFIHICAD